MSNVSINVEDIIEYKLWLCLCVRTVGDFLSTSLNSAGFPILLSC